MPSEQGNSRDKVKRLAVWALLTSVCLIVGYIESIVNLFFIAPGVKLGLANSVACALVLKDDVKGAVAVNLSRILISALLFGSPVSLMFALSGGTVSVTAMILLKKCRHLSVLGISGAGGVLHNIAQCAVGIVFIGIGIIYYLPILLLSGVVCGVAVGFLAKLILKRIEKSGKYV
ncbi:MAG: Gx transporter family protein [Clostridia bacterium]|nr:Gx transporter family protein [Clostridia bacterium]